MAGGAGLDAVIGASAELYDPATGSFTPTGSMTVRRDSHSAVLLEDGRILVVGQGWQNPPPSADLYDPSTGSFMATDSPDAAGGIGNVGVRLADGTVLVVGPGYAGEIYDPETERFTTTDSTENCRSRHQATALLDGRVLVTAGYCYVENSFDPKLKSAEIYDPLTRRYTRTGDLSQARGFHTATLLPGGEVLVAQGENASIEVFNPAAGQFSTVGTSAWPLRKSAATRLESGEVLITGGGEEDRSTGGSPPVDNAMLVRYVPGKPFTGTLTLPSGWITTPAAEVSFSGETSDGSLRAGALRNGEGSWGEWVPAADGETVTTEWHFGGDGRNQRVWLRLRDASGQVLIVVSGLVKVDTAAPAGSITIEDGAETTASEMVTLTVDASDATSGVSEMSFSNDGTAWSDWEPFATIKSWSLAAGDGRKQVYARFRDRAGNVSPAASDSIVLDTEGPTPEEISINGGALSSTSTSVALRLAASDQGTGVSHMSFSNDGNTWSTWQSYATEASWTLSAGDGEKRVYVRFQDGVGNVSAVVSDSIELDTTVEQEYGVSIDKGALFTNVPAVTLHIGAPGQTAEMRVSNDGGFEGSGWEPYASRKSWTITQYGHSAIPRVVYVRYRDLNGVVSGTYQDDIILDILPPTGSITIADPTSERTTPGSNGRLPAQASAAEVTLSLSADDDVSGVDAMRLSNNDDFASASWQPFDTQESWTLGSSRTVYVQFRDHAGNVSTTYAASSGEVETSTPTTTAMPSNTATPAATSSSTTTAMPTNTATPVATSSPTATAAATILPSQSPSATSIPTVQATGTAVPTATATGMATATATSVSTQSATQPPTATRTTTPGTTTTPRPSVSPSATRTTTPGTTTTPQPSVSPTRSMTATSSPTTTPTANGATRTPTVVASPTGTAALLPSQTATTNPSPSATRTASPTPTNGAGRQGFVYLPLVQKR